MPLNAQLKELKDEINGLVSQFQSKNDERLAQLENSVVADPITREELEAINTKLSEKMDKYTEVHDGIRSELDTLARQNALGGGGGDPSKAEANAKTFSNLLSAERNAPVSVSVDELVAYQNAFDRYCRVGDKGRDIMNELSVGSDPDGGYWVSPDRGGRIVEMIYESSPMRQVAMVESIGTDALEGILDLDEASTGWVGEAESRPETGTPTIGEWRIPVHEQYAMPITTQKVLDDAQRDVGSWLEGKISSKLARTENTAFVNGDGDKKPRGFLTYAAGVPSATAWNVIEQVNSGAAGAFASSDPGDKLIDLLFKLKTIYLSNAQWMMSRATFAAVRKLQDGQGNYLFAVNFNELGLGLNLLGHPIVLADDMPALSANSLSVAVGDFAEGYTIVDRQGVRVLRDPFTTKGKVKFYTTKRVGGDVVNFEAIKIMKFAA